MLKYGRWIIRNWEGCGWAAPVGFRRPLRHCVVDRLTFNWGACVASGVLHSTSVMFEKNGCGLSSQGSCLRGDAGMTATAGGKT
jgi:hypothetical protein